MGSLDDVDIGVNSFDTWVIDMTIDEVITIKENMSLQTVGMSVSEKTTFYSTGAKEVQKKIDEIRERNKANNTGNAVCV